LTSRYPLADGDSMHHHLAIPWFLAIVIAFAACNQQTANANVPHVLIMQTATEHVAPSPAPVNYPQALIERFWSKVDKNGPTMEGPHYEGIGNCWVWTAGTFNKGYGAFYLYGQNWGAHKFAFETMVSAIPDGMCVLHRCDRRNCVNPSHLRLGTYQDNALDAVHRERTATKAKGTNGRTLHPEKYIVTESFIEKMKSIVTRGETHHKSKLTVEDVLEIRRRHADGETFASLAKDFGIKPCSTRDVVLRKSWSHI